MEFTVWKAVHHWDTTWRPQARRTCRQGRGERGPSRRPGVPVRKAAPGKEGIGGHRFHSRECSRRQRRQSKRERDIAPASEGGALRRRSSSVNNTRFFRATKTVVGVLEVNGVYRQGGGPDERRKVLTSIFRTLDKEKGNRVECGQAREGFPCPRAKGATVVNET